MSRDLEIVRGGFAHYLETGDFREDLIHPDFVWDMSTFSGWPERQTYRGIEGAREFMRNWLEAWEDWSLEVEDLLDAGDSVVAIVHQHGRSRATGVPTDMHFAMVWVVRDGRQFRMRMYASAREGLEAAGLDG